MSLPKDVEIVLRQAEQHTTNTLARIRAAQDSLESVSDHHMRMMESIEKSRVLLAGLSSYW